MAIFTNDFEEGDFTAWTSSTGDCDIVHVPVHHNAHAAHFLEDANTGTACYARKSLVAIDDVYTRGYVRYAQLPTANAETRCLALMSGATVKLVQANIRDDFGDVKWTMRTLNEANRDVTDITPVVDTWYCIELWYHRGVADGEAKMWINDVEKASRGALPSDVAVENVQVMCEASQAVSTIDVNNYIDCVKVDSAYIGLEAAGGPTVKKGSCVPAMTALLTKFSSLKQTREPKFQPRTFPKFTPRSLI